MSTINWLTVICVVAAIICLIISMYFRARARFYNRLQEKLQMADRGIDPQFTDKELKFLRKL